jgi:two-component SAPR family response regulator
MPSHRDERFGSMTVFVVEDESLVALNLEDMLSELGHRVLGPAMRIARARSLIEGDFFADAAILDVNVAGEPVFPIAEMLVDRGVPIVFATGYDRDGLPEAWHDRTILQKPYTIDEVSRSLDKAVGRS